MQQKQIERVKWDRQSWSVGFAEVADSLGSFQKWKSLSHVQLFVTPWTIQSMDLSKQEYWSG